jgi:hypothetical protein
VAIGLLGTAVFTWGALQSKAEADALGLTGSPATVNAETATVPAGQRARWVTLSDPSWACDEVVVREHGIVESWLFGRVDWTQVPVGGGRRLVVVKFDGAVDCRALAGRSQTGALSRDDGNVWRGGGQVAYEVRDAHPGAEILLLRPGLDAPHARHEAAGLAAFAAGALAFTAWWARAWARLLARRNAALPPSAAIEPR